MTVQTSKNPQVDIAEDNAFFPSEYSLSQYTSPVSDLDGVDYPKPYRGKHKILVIAADERYLPTDNGKLFSTASTQTANMQQSLFLVVMAHLLVYLKARTWLPLYSGQSKMTVLLSPFATARRLFWRFATAITH